MTINSLYQKVKKLDTKVLIENAIDNTAEELADINRERLKEGLNADNEAMPLYSKRSVEEFGKTPGPIRLLDTGAFQAGITSIREGDNIVTQSSDDKNELLTETERYFPIFGTKGEYRVKYLNEHLRPELNSSITRAIGLKFRSNG